MTIYDTTIRASMNQPLINVTIKSFLIKDALYYGPFADIPECLFDRQVLARLYDRQNKHLTLWI